MFSEGAAGLGLTSGGLTRPNESDSNEMAFEPSASHLEKPRTLSLGNASLPRHNGRRRVEGTAGSERRCSQGDDTQGYS